MSMHKRIPEVAGLMAALVLAGGCDSLNLENPNAPDTPHLLASPTSVLSLAQGAMRTSILTTHGGYGADQYPVLTMSVMARGHVAMWNNFHIRYYTGCTNASWDVYTTATNGTCGNPLSQGPPYPRVAWANDPAAAERTQIEALWYGHYSALSSARDVLKRIRVDNLVITDAGTTKMVETVTLLAQALSLSELALNYDHAFIVDYNSNLNALGWSTAAQVRDVALAKFDTVVTLAGANSFATTVGFFGPGITYSNVQIAQIANTMAARTLAYFPRNATDNAAVAWARVVSYASKGISSGTPFDWKIHQDACNTWCDFLKVWSNDMTTMRLHTRVAHLMDPATQPDPWNNVANGQPNSPDKRLGNGAYRGDAAYAANVLNSAVDPVNGGYDYVWTSTKEFGNPTRGAWHQSAVGQIRYDSLPGCGDNPQGSSSPGDKDSPIVLAAENDLLWAEGLIRTGGTGAAALINFTRVGPDRLGRPRGGLPAAADADANLLQKLQYEQDVELLGSSPAVFYNQRRIDKLEPNTPHEMPVPAKELNVLGLALYTCGGAGAHADGSCQAFPVPAPPAAAASALVQNAPQVWADLTRQQQDRMLANRVLNRLLK